MCWSGYVPVSVCVLEGSRKDRVLNEGVIEFAIFSEGVLRKSGCVWDTGIFKLDELWSSRNEHRTTS